MVLFTRICLKSIFFSLVINSFILMTTVSVLVLMHLKKLNDPHCCSLLNRCDFFAFFRRAEESMRQVESLSQAQWEGHEKNNSCCAWLLLCTPTPPARLKTQKNRTGSAGYHCCGLIEHTRNRVFFILPHTSLGLSHMLWNSCTLQGMHTWTKSGYNNEDEDISLFCLATLPLLLQQCCTDKAWEKLMVIFTDTCDSTGLLCTVCLINLLD